MDNCLAFKLNKCDLNYTQLFFLMIGTISTGIMLPTWIVARYIWLPLINKNKKYIEEEAEENKEIPYELTYPPQEADNTNKNFDELLKNYVIENTPNGLVILRWNNTDDGFEYWADNNIAYKYLEVAARKYIKFYSCRDIYINRGQLLRDRLKIIQQEIAENKKKLESIHQKEQNTLDEEKLKDSDEDDDDVFAKLKSNKKKNNKNNLKLKFERDDIVCVKSNKYMNRGKLDECLFYTQEKKETVPVKEVSFSQWKLWSS